VGPHVWYQTILGEAGKLSDHEPQVRAPLAGSASPVRIILPDRGLSDMNDVLQQGGGWQVQSDYQP
jgi:hypothetical protein